MNWQPSLDWEDAKLRAEIFHKVRSFFMHKKIVEVETPILSQGTITDPFVDAFTTPYRYMSDSDFFSSTALYLQTSPEYLMKRLLASGYQSIYQITKAFRDEPHGRFHNPEFTLLEWYRIGFDHIQLMDEVEALLNNILGAIKTRKVSYQDLFLELVDIDPLATTRAELLASLTNHQKDISWVTEKDPIDTLLQVVFSEVIESLIDTNIAYFVYDFPISQASLARKSQLDNRVAHRFECYFKGIELANGFYELTDPVEQEVRFIKDNELRRLNNTFERPIDKRFLTAMDNGLPDCAGVALGLDRLVMLALDKAHIEDVITFSIDQA